MQHCYGVAWLVEVQQQPAVHGSFRLAPCVLRQCPRAGLLTGAGHSSMLACHMRSWPILLVACLDARCHAGDVTYVVFLHVGTVHGGVSYLRTASRTSLEREAQRKAARLALDTSVHGNSQYARMVSV